MTPVTFIFQFCDAFVEGTQFVFQFLNFMLKSEIAEQEIYRRLVASLGPDPANLFGAVLTWPLRIASAWLLQSTVFFAGSSAMLFAAVHGLLVALSTQLNLP